MIVIDPVSPRPPSWPTSTCGCGRAPTPGAWPRWPRCWCRRTWSTRRSSPSTSTAPTPCRDVLARGRRSPTTRERCGVDEELIRAAARRIAGADSVAVFEDLGIQQAPALHAVLLPREAAVDPHRQLRQTAAGSTCTRRSRRCSATGAVGRTPVTGAPIIAGLVPCNVIPEEILTDHPDRFRAMIVESSNPAHSLADSAALPRGVRGARAARGHRRRDDRDRPAGRLRAAGREPVREVGGDVLQLRVPAQHLPPAPPAARAAAGHAARARDLRAARARARRRRRRRARSRCARPPTRAWQAYAEAFLAAVGANPDAGQAAAVSCSTRPSARRCPTASQGAAALWGLAQRRAMTYPDAVRRAGHADGNALFDAILASRSGVTFTATSTRTTSS